MQDPDAIVKEALEASGRRSLLGAKTADGATNQLGHRHPRLALQDLQDATIDAIDLAH